MIKGAVSSHLQKRFGHKIKERFSHSGLVTLYTKFGYIFTINTDRKTGNFCAVFTNILFHYTPPLSE